MKRVHMFVSGLVQGVFYRASTEAEAKRLGLTGLVRNLPDGRVEAVAEGPEEALADLCQWAEEGPRDARVERVERQWGPATGEFAGFETRR